MFNGDDNSYCMVRYWKQATMYFQSGMTVMINIIACMIFERLSTFEMNKTVNEDTKSSFNKIVLMQFLNIAIANILVNFKVFESNLLFGYLPFLSGTYNDFDFNWYSQIGTALCLTMFM